MKEELKEWQRQNGNVTYTTKELIQGIHVKVDNSDKKISNQLGACSARFISRTTFWSVVGLLASGVTAAFAAVINFFRG